MEKAKVYYTKTITPEAMVQLYEVIGKKLTGKIAVKLHSGEVGNQNFLRPEFMKPMIDHVKGTIVESNTAYDGERNTTDKHWKTMEVHGWSEIAPVDILDGDGDLELTVSGGKQIDKNYVGSHLTKYDAMLVLSHFKGHPMGGFGGALKNISIGIASSHGKAYIHGAGKPEEMWTANHDAFLESMADASKSILEYFKGEMVFINVMKNMSVDCDCCAKAEDPKIQDIGILASLDPVALDQACLDLVYQSKDEGKKDLIERIESRNGKHTVDAASEIGVGSQAYELIDIDKKQAIL